MGLKLADRDRDHGSNRPLVIAGVGALAVSAAIVLNYLLLLPAETPRAPPTIDEATAPTAGAPPARPVPVDTDAAAPVMPAFELVRVNPAGDAVIAGRAAPGDRLAIVDGDDVLGEVIADERGEWVFVPNAPLAPGPHRLRLADDGRSVIAAEEMVIVVPGLGARE